MIDDVGVGLDLVVYHSPCIRPKGIFPKNMFMWPSMSAGWLVYRNKRTIRPEGPVESTKKSICTLSVHTGHSHPPQHRKNKRNPTSISRRKHLPPLMVFMCPVLHVRRLHRFNGEQQGYPGPRAPSPPSRSRG